MFMLSSTPYGAASALTASRLALTLSQPPSDISWLCRNRCWGGPRRTEAEIGAEVDLGVKVEWASESARTGLRMGGGGGRRDM
jgi:hypothetical protein